MLSPVGSQFVLKSLSVGSNYGLETGETLGVDCEENRISLCTMVSGEVIVGSSGKGRND